MQRFRYEDFVNRDGRRVLDEKGRQGIDGVTGLGSSTEVRCGLILQALVEHAPYLADFQLDDLAGWVRQISRFEDFVNCDGRRVLDEKGQQGIDGVTGLGSSTEVRCGLILQALVEHAPHLADFQLDDLAGWVRQIRDGVPHGQPRGRSLTG
jgi:hypothetical protein